MFGLFRSKKEPDAPARTHVVTPSSPSIHPHAAAASKLRRRPTTHAPYHQLPKRGMWVVWNDKVGVLTDIDSSDNAVVMLVDHKGHNHVGIAAPSHELRQAWFEEIPEPRRPEYEAAARLGYHARPA